MRPAAVGTVATSRVVLPVRPPYDLVRSLTCGQAFGWRCSGASAEGVFAGRRVRLEQVAGGIEVEGLFVDGPTGHAQVQRLRHYLGLDEPLLDIEGRLREDRVLRRILPRTTGIAILRQDPWQCLVSFVISSFNNIPKIELALGRLAGRFGEPGPDGVRLFPRPEALARASMPALQSCVLGYRAPYVARLARLVASGGFDLEAPRVLPYEDARQMLLDLPGVGEKVADCVLLFAYAKGEAFPVDVWVMRAVERWYFGGRPVTERRIREFARGRFGALAGYAQQHLFFYARRFANPRRTGT